MTEKNTLVLPEEISVRTLASAMKVDPTVVIGKLISNGVMATINQTLDYETAALLAEQMGFTTSLEEKTVKINKSAQGKDAVERAPIVTIMGHVDHGKTSLLDYIRRSNIAAGESGGITQHISAYQIEFTTSEKQKRKITFIDTPGHEAFSALREHGATLTDIVVLVVAADDGVKPQTLEVIQHAKKANVPMIVAINKADLPTANIDRVKQQLSENDLTPEEWGGSTVMLPISAKTGQGVPELLEMIALTADLLELKADPDAVPEGIVIEANLDKQVGPVATVLMYNGTLHPGQVLVIGSTYGRIRSLEDDLRNRISSAGPSKPAIITGLKDVPSFGERIEVVPNEKVARSMTQSDAKHKKHGAKEGANTYKVVLKADVGGSLAAFEDSLSKLSFKDATIEVLSSGIGQVNENDINLAKTSGATVISFRSAPIKRVADIAEKEGVILKEYWIIYDAIEFLNSELKRIATPVFVTEEVARLKVLAVFSRKAKNAIVGGEVTQGVVVPKADVAVLREKEEIGTAKLKEIKIGKLTVERAETGTQCGVSLEEVSDIAEGDMLVFSITREE